MDRKSLGVDGSTHGSAILTDVKERLEGKTCSLGTSDNFPLDLQFLDSCWATKCSSWLEPSFSNIPGEFHVVCSTHMTFLEGIPQL